MRAVLAFVDADCNLTRAGTRLGLSQPAVHARLTALSRQLDVTLYERRGRRLALTDAGRRTVARAREMVSSADSLVAELRGDVDADVVTVACGEGALVHVIADRVAALVKTKAATLRFVIRDGPQAADAVRRGDADIAVVAGPAGNAADLKTSTMVSTRLIAVGSPRLLPHARAPSAGPDTIDLPALLTLPLIIPAPGRPLRGTIDDAAAAVGVQLRVAVEVSGWEAVVRLAQLGVGVGVINDVVVTSGLRRRPIAGLPPVSYRALRRKGRCREVVDVVCDALLARSPLCA